MPEEFPDTAAILHPARLSRRKPHRFRWAPDAAARDRTARMLDILALPAATLAGEITAAGRDDWHLTARLTATVEQACVVTLAPVRSLIDEAVERRYVADLPAPEADEIEMPEDDTVEALPAIIDLAAVMTEALALALPPWPRAPGAELAAVLGSDAGAGAAAADEVVRPFARLGEMLRKPGDGTS
jgi:uncharacterized metal-binding protein YceD (DUF177 family)